MTDAPAAAPADAAAATPTLALASDDAGVQLRRLLAEHLTGHGIQLAEYPDEPSDTYSDVAVRVARRVADGTHERAVLICGTGIGVCIAANKVPGVYAALCHDTYSAVRARLSNNAQILALGARVVGPELAKSIVDHWLEHDFADGPSSPKLARLAALEKELLGDGTTA